jgi:hypothetical protein
MIYFIVFNKRGIVEHEEGEAPHFLNPLIRSIYIQQAKGSKNLRDLLMEYRIEGQSIFLSLNNKPILDELIQKYKKEENDISNVEEPEKRPMRIK